jgi:hypothetical protein
MTSGNITNNDRVPATGGGSWGTRKQIVWSGADRTPSPKSPHNTYETYREYTDFAGIRQRKVFTFRIPHSASTGVNRTVKRKYDEEHPYTKWVQRIFDDKVGYNVPSNFELWADMTHHGVIDWTPENLLDANDQIKLVGKMKDFLDGSDFNLGVFLGEMGPALDLIGDTAGRVGGALGWARRGQFGRAADVLFAGTKRKPSKKHPNIDMFDIKSGKKALATNWLELQYGWLPLLKDVEGAAHMLAHHLNVPMRKTYRSKVRREKQMPTRISQVGFLPSQQAFGTCSKSHTRWLVARVEEKGSIPQMLGLANPELIAWELLPYSFVADWFIPLGSWMEARALVSRLKGTFITSDKKTSIAFSPTSKFFSFQPRGNYSQVEFARTVESTVKVPMPTFKPLGKVASWQHCANAVGLLIAGFADR